MKKRSRRGELRTEPQRPKRVTTWRYADVEGRVLDVPVYMVESYDMDSVTRAQTRFRVALDAPDVKAEDVDINALKTRVWELIAERFTVAWEAYLYVTVGGNRRVIENEYEDTTTSTLEIDYRLVELAAPGGRQIHRYPAADSGTREGWPDVGSEGNHYGRDNMRALVPDTPENRAALDRAAAYLDQLYASLTGLFAPASIAGTLVRLARSDARGVTLALHAPAAPTEAQ